MKPFLVDVPVRITIWIRSECQKKQLDVLRKARPSVLFIQSDGGRNEEEWENIRRNRKLVDEGIDWDCQVYKIYEDENRGLYELGHKMLELIWSKADRCILLEDDQLPSVSFFRYCAELLERYKDDQRIECICGFNNLGVWERASADYFFSRQGMIWGIATWKRVVDEYFRFDYGGDEYVMELLRQRTRHNKNAWRLLNAYRSRKIFEGHEASLEFFLEFNMYAQNRLQIVPKYNLISNSGASGSGEHADEISQMPRGIRKIYNAKTCEMEFPLKHPLYVIPDVEYEKQRNRVMAYNRPFLKAMRDIERALIKLKKGDVRYIVNKLKYRSAKRGGQKTEK